MSIGSTRPGSVEAQALIVISAVEGGASSRRNAYMVPDRTVSASLKQFRVPRITQVEVQSRLLERRRRKRIGIDVRSVAGSQRPDPRDRAHRLSGCRQD